MYDYLVVLVSFSIRNIMILLSSYIGFFSRTKETKFIMFSVFSITFINYGVIQFAASWDFRKKDTGLIAVFFQGLYPDFNRLWFNDVGSLIISIMLSNMIWPPIEYFIYLSIRILYRMKD